MQTLIACIAMIAAMLLAGFVMDINMAIGSAFLLFCFGLVVVVYVVLPGRD